MTESKTGRTQGMVSEGVLQGSREGPRLLQPWGAGPPGAGGPGSEWEVAAGLGVCEAFGGLGALPHEPGTPAFLSSHPLLRASTKEALGKCLLNEDRGLILSQGVRGWVRARRGWLAGCLLITSHLCMPPVVGEPSLQRPPLCSLKVRSLGQFLISGRLPSLALGPGDLEVDKTWSTPPSLLRRAGNRRERE